MNIAELTVNLKPRPSAGTVVERDSEGNIIGTRSRKAGK
jgi:hypothetical protein